MGKHYSVVVFGAKDITRSFVEYLNKNVCCVDLVVTISEQVPKEKIVSGYGNMDTLQAEWGTEIFKTDAYDLKDGVTRAFFMENTFGIGISMNWSRLIPEWILERFESGIFGLHGSCGYLPFGQGRATLNWSLIHGVRRFVMHVFKLDGGVDSPNIHSRMMFEVNEFDDIRSLQYKDLLASERLAAGLLQDYLSGATIKTTLREDDAHSLYPGRKPEDGRINMLSYTREIYNLVRGVSHPFPGAFVYVGGMKVLLWSVRPFDGILDFEAYRTGEVIDVLDGHPIIRTVDGSLLILDYDAERVLQVGDVLS